MKHSSPLPYIAMLFGALTLTNCSNNVELPQIDCSASDLSISIAGQVDADCAVPGSLTVGATGGTEPYEFSTDGINFQSSPFLDGLPGGDYTVTLRDADGCSVSTAATVSAETGAITLSISTQDADCGSSNGSVEIEPTGGVEPYNFSLNGGAFQSTGVFSGLSNGSSSVTVQDAEGCEVTRNVVVASGVSLTDDIMPIIDSNCAVTGCHNGSRSPDLRTTAGIINSASRVRSRTQARTMPPAGRADLSQNAIDLIDCWVRDGAPNN